MAVEIEFSKCLGNLFLLLTNSQSRYLTTLKVSAGTWSNLPKLCLFSPTAPSHQEWIELCIWQHSFERRSWEIIMLQVIWIWPPFGYPRIVKIKRKYISAMIVSIDNCFWIPYHKYKYISIRTVKIVRKYDKDYMSILIQCWQSIIYSS